MTARPPLGSSPRPSSRACGSDALRVAELMRHSDRGRSQSPAPVTAGPATLASLCPTWSDAITQMSVNSSVQAQLQKLVQPRLDTFAERLGSIVAAAQSEMRDLERLVEKSEARVENRLTGLEGRLAVLTDGASRTEQRERDLNTRIAGIAESLLNSAENSACEVVRGQRLEVLERTLQEKAERLQVVEESCRKSVKSVQKLDDRLDDLEEHSRSIPLLVGELRSLATSSAAISGMPAAAEQGGRLRALEEQVQTLSCALGGNGGVQSCQALALLVDAQRSDVEALASQLMETGHQLGEQVQRREEQQEVTRSCRSEQQALTARVDDINLRVGALKVKADGLEGRLHSGLERSERTEKTRELEMGRTSFSSAWSTVATRSPRIPHRS